MTIDFAFAFAAATAAVCLSRRLKTRRNKARTFSWARGGASWSRSISLFGPDGGGGAAGCPAADSSRSCTSGSRDSRLALSAAGRDCIGGGGRGGSAVAESGGGDEEEGGVGATFHISGIRGRSPAESTICGVVGAIEVRLKPWR